MERAKSRDDVKPALDHWRHVEKIAQMSATDKVYRPCGRLVEVDCNKLDKDAASEAIISALENFIRDPNRNKVQLPPFSLPNVTVPLPLIPKHNVFEQLKKDIHMIIENPTNRTDTPPLSTIGGYVDLNLFQNCRKNNRSVARFMNVTLKVDGQRFLVVRHREYGFLGFPFIFNFCLDFNSLFAKADLLSDTKLDKPLDVILDTELQTDCMGKTMLHIIDFVYFHGYQAKLLSFLERYRMLREWIPTSYHYPECLSNPQNFCLKLYVPINKLYTILNRLEDAPFAVDGIVFQHNEIYRLGMDRYMLKWKPQELCTADFRLDKGERSVDEKTWTFKLYVIDYSSNNRSAWQEVPFPGAIGVFTVEEVLEKGLSEGKIVELFLHKIETDKFVTYDSKSMHCTVWSFHRVREDKPGPNKLTTVKQIVELSHLTYADLLRETRSVRYVEPLKIIHTKKD
ncbi:unnamed protein product [Phytomonas sp. Hart1]|nr:unnamed protein product [Phytomonas sp. Hart1]|eukprot:CCW70622.1 unnamed protein product [Phytomonas sp. isolate Hart1]